MLVVLIIREAENILPNGNTEILPGDLLVAAAPEFEDRETLTLYETPVGKGHPWLNKTLQNISVPTGCLVALVLRNGASIIPDGNTQILKDDVLVTARF